MAPQNPVESVFTVAREPGSHDPNLGPNNWGKWVARLSVPLVAIGMRLLVLFAGTFNSVGAPEAAWAKVSPIAGSEIVAAAQGARQLSPEQSSAIVYVAAYGVVGGLLLVSFGLATAYRRRSRAQKIADSRPTLVDGPAAIYGKVELGPDDCFPAVSLHIRCTGPEEGWRELNRELVVYPFVLLTADGTGIQVEPDDRMLVELHLSAIENPPGEWFRGLGVMQGSYARVTGVLTGMSATDGDTSYREAPPHPSLRPAPSDRMTLSPGASGEKEMRASEFQSPWVLRFALLLGFQTLFCLPAYEILTFDGLVVHAKVTDTATWPPTGGSTADTHYAIKAIAALPDGKTVPLESECDLALYRAVAEHHDITVPFVVSRHWRRIFTLGERPTFGPIWAGFLIVLSLAGLIVYLYSCVRRYRRVRARFQ